jgi:hypothetical protein
MGYGLYGILNSMVLKRALESNSLLNGAKIQEECDLNQISQIKIVFKKLLHRVSS